jgi:hypothetical protein
VSELDHSKLDSMIENIRTLPQLGIEAAPAAAKAWRETIVDQISKGVDPDGVAWARRKSDDGPVLQGAADKLSVVATGATLFARLTDYVARHHLGRARGGVVRRILPLAGIPSAAKVAIKAKLDEAFRKHMKVE